MKKRYAFIVALALALAFPLGSVSADSETVEYDYLAGTGLLCGLPIPNPCPDIAMAPSGDTVEITGEGTFTVHPNMSLAGGGTFTHKDAAGNVLGSGEWTATELISFHSYGSGEAQGLPSNFWGGQAQLRVNLIVGGAVVGEGILVIDCELGKVPGGAAEGVTLLVYDSPLGPIHFNKSVSGITIFLRQ
jgi:hypothetical protein